MNKISYAPLERPGIPGSPGYTGRERCFGIRGVRRGQVLDRTVLDVKLLSVVFLWNSVSEQPKWIMVMGKFSLINIATFSLAILSLSSTRDLTSVPGDFVHVYTLKSRV